MKKIIATLLLIVLSAFAQDINKSPDTDPKFHSHRGLYFSNSLAYSYIYTRHIYVEDTEDHYTKYNDIFNGSGLYNEIRLGGSIANIVSVYAVTGFGYHSGTFEEEKKERKINKDKIEQKDLNDDDAKEFRVLLGLGAEFYPFQRTTSPFYGIFFGLSSGVVMDVVRYTYKKRKKNRHDTDTLIDMFGAFEIGKEWWISRRWSFGTSLFYNFGAYNEKDEEERDATYKDSFAVHSIGISFRITH